MSFRTPQGCLGFRTMGIWSGLAVQIIGASQARVGGGAMEVLKTVLSRIPLLEVTGDVDHPSAQDLEECLEDSLRIDGPHTCSSIGPR